MKTTKTLITTILCCLGLNVIAQSNNLKGEVTDTKKIENFSIMVEVDSAEEIDSTFKVEDFEDIFEEAKVGEKVTFKLKCNGKVMSNGVKSSMSYTIEGNTNEKEKFLERVSKIRTSAIKYYKSKN